MCVDMHEEGMLVLMLHHSESCWSSLPGMSAVC